MKTLQSGSLLRLDILLIVPTLVRRRFNSTTQADGLTFNGLVGQLQKQESDIGFADLYVNLDR